MRCWLLEAVFLNDKPTMIHCRNLKSFAGGESTLIIAETLGGKI